jgi:hypothetical protein
MSEDDDALANDHRLVARNWVLVADTAQGPPTSSASPGV